jgi:phosphoribosylformylglycinamidine (FGAM) synthase-like amidotransferase family enzyme
MMPHPERASSGAMSNLDGKKVFELLGLNDQYCKAVHVFTS